MRDFVDVDFELFGDQHRNRGVSPLSHLDEGHHERDLAGAVDAQKSVRREWRVGGEAYPESRRAREDRRPASIRRRSQRSR